MLLCSFFESMPSKNLVWKALIFSVLHKVPIFTDHPFVGIMTMKHTIIVYSKIKSLGLVLSCTHSLRMWYWIILHSFILETFEINHELQSAHEWIIFQSCIWTEYGAVCPRCLRTYTKPNDHFSCPQMKIPTSSLTFIKLIFIIVWDTPED